MEWNLELERFSSLLRYHEEGSTVQKSKFSFERSLRDFVRRIHLVGKVLKVCCILSRGETTDFGKYQLDELLINHLFLLLTNSLQSVSEIKTPNNFGEREEYIIIQINLKQRWCIRIKKKKNLSSLILENYRRTKIEEQGLAQTLSLSVGSGSEAYPSIPQCGEILIMRYYDKRRTIRPY